MACSLLRAWLMFLAHPAGARKPQPPPLPGERWMELVKLADQQGVLPAVAANLQERARNGSDGVQASQEQLGQALREAQTILRRRAAFCLVMRSQLAEVRASFSAAGVPCMVLKGPEFADRLYPNPGLRPFTDIDLLIRAADKGSARDLLGRAGYAATPERQAPQDAHPGEHAQESWTNGQTAGGTVELHWNVVNSPTLRRRISIGFDDLQTVSLPGDSLAHPSPSALLLIAAIHAATAHKFDRLQPLCDVAMAARGAAGPLDVAWLRAIALKAHASLSLAAACALAGECLGEPACEAVVRDLNLPRRARWTRRLLNAEVALGAESGQAALRRQLFREMLKRI
ncbi:MAG: nucleotidyltransferase family protein [Candidatus Brocadiia bacterium]